MSIKTLRLVFLSLALSASVLAQESQEAKKVPVVRTSDETPIVSGHAIYEDTGQPASRQRVQLVVSEALVKFPSRLRVPTTITNENGEFKLRGVAAGEYYVVARSMDEHGPEASHIIPVRSGDRAADEARIEKFKKENIRIVVDGQRPLELTLRLPNPHFGTISGRVLDPAGQPAPRASVHLVSKGKPFFGFNMQADDEGLYKFLGVRSGDYVISASPPAQDSSGTEMRRGVEGLVGATYFPSTLKFEDSPMVNVLADRDTGNIDIKLITRPLHRISGTLKMRGDNRPVANAALRLSVNQLTEPMSDTSRHTGIEAAMSNYISQTDNSGRWSFSNVPDGTYRLFIQARPGNETGQLFVQKEQDLTVGGQDLTDVLIEVTEGARISGEVSFEGAQESPQFVHVDAGDVKAHASTSTRLEGAGQFVLQAVPAGDVIVSAFAFPQEMFYVKSIEANGSDLMNGTLTVAEGDNIKGVRVVISGNVGVVTGRVLSVSDAPQPGVNVSIQRVGAKLRLFGGKLTGVTDAQGKFSLSAAPGDYVLIVWRREDGPRAFGDAMTAAQQENRKVTLMGGDKKEMDVRLP